MQNRAPLNAPTIIGVVILLVLVGVGAYLLGRPPQAAGPEGGFIAELATTELVAGENRIVFGLTVGGSKDVIDADVDIEWTSPSGKRTESRALYVGKAFEERGAYSAMVDLPEVGDWKMVVNARIKPDPEEGAAGDPIEASYDLSVPVYEEGDTPALGEAVPASETAIASSTEDASTMCTAIPACSMHDHSIAGSIAEGRPALIFFAAPGRCTSRLCGPMLSIIESAKKSFSGEADFIHVEISRPGTSGPVPSVKEWGLIGEPWVFVVDDRGKLAAKFEGPTMPEELTEALERVTAGE